MEISSSEHVTQTSILSFKPGETLDLGVINLEIPIRIKLTYYTSGVENFKGSEEKHTIINAGTKWEAFDDLPWGWDLEFKQKEGKVIFNWSYGPCYISDLGAGDIKDFLDEDSHDKGWPVIPYNIEAQSGHVYLLDQQHFQHWVLFKCEFIK